MDIETVSSYIGYPVIFCASPEEAAANLYRLISKQQCGYDEGADYWLRVVSDLLDGDHNLQQLNSCGAKLTMDQWRRALRMLQADLSAFTGCQTD